ncbi:MAG: hypothetical protein HY874_12255 [Chloroflexi bacterium]|nr:hypothetical protein [Chloroflexota bacterium]
MTNRPIGTLSDGRRDGMVSAVIFLIDAESPKEESVSESSFLSQLEQRTQQVKITLANLEAEKVRIEGLIAQLQPLVPHYDALVAAERSISEAQITLDAAEQAAVTSQAHLNPWEQPQPRASSW